MIDRSGNRAGLDDLEVASDVAIKKIVSFKRGSLTVELTDTTVQERNGGTLAWRNNNPGNLKHGAFAKKQGSIGPGEGGHAVFPSYEIGSRAHWELLFNEKSRYFNLSISEAIAIYAPADDPAASNDPINYANYVAKKTGVPPSTNISSLSDIHRHRMLIAMQAMEGYKVGTILTL